MSEIIKNIQLIQDTTHKQYFLVETVVGSYQAERYVDGRWFTKDPFKTGEVQPATNSERLEELFKELR